ncbi:DUF3089 domain-containing protein [Williamsia serinedens]|uniref:DUF3089 domain-containing protein n=1 Tax=Williamsia serinedens TaxID=391736 RepID=A0ABT1GYE5_9NOCA|nr:DUF3089 domain-containing protein [Williamsia serinedens]MCP2160010.1 Protein of unknown function (DUF3089) [Williamsia serinedens]
MRRGPARPTHRVIALVAVLAGILAVVGIPAVATAGPSPSSTLWLCRPGQPADPCGGRGDAPVDCFYVYPTVSLAPGVNAPRSVGPEERLIANQQAEPFGARCRVWAPVYRQSTLRGLFSARSTADRTAALRVAYTDVLSAWRDYLAHDNGGRGVVLVGHSQGTLMLRTLLREEIEPSPVHDRLVSAILLGGNVLTRSGSLVGGDFTRTPLCTARAETGCVVAYSTFGRTPPADTRYGVVPTEVSSPSRPLPAGDGYSVACTNPAALGSAATAPLRSRIAGRPVTGYNGRCTTGAGPHVLQVSGGDPVPAVALPQLPNATWGLHLLDVNIAQDDLVDLVGAQARTYLAHR